MSEFLARIRELSPMRLALLAHELQTRLDRAEQERADPIAIIGLGCRVPGADGPEAYWELLAAERDAVSPVPSDRWDVDAHYDPDPDAPGRTATRWGGFLDRVDQFDAPFFGISRREAVSMDPQQRLLLEVCWEALEHAGQSPRALGGSATGVFVGMATGDYYGMLRARGLERVDAYMATGTAHSVATGRVAYVLGLRGPNLAVDTACSSSLVAVHLACQSLRAGESRMALAGGVNLILSPDVTIALSRSHMMAPDGRCKAFDARADGFVRGEGCGIVVLKRLSDARADGDRVLAVIRGSAVNQDGRSSGITAPNGVAQQEVIRRALETARVRPEEVGYVEAHGTGTSLGDPIEAHALSAEFAGRTADRPLVVGSVKANIGHLEAAAGVAGLIKTVLALQHGRIPGQLHFRRMNPQIDWAGLPVVIPVGGRAWEPGVTRRVAGVSSFGFGGTNAHVIVEEAPADTAMAAAADALDLEPDSAAEPPSYVLPLSARSEEGLRELRGRYAARLAASTASIADVCFTAGVGRAHQSERAAFVAESREELVASLQREPEIRGTADGPPPVAFLFSGQGAQWAGMGREADAREPVFRGALDRAAAALGPHVAVPLREALWGPAAARHLADTAVAQPALVALAWALAALWRAWGVVPGAVLGHSVGEYAALCVAGVWTLEDTLALVAARGRAMAALGPGWGMTAVQGPRAAVGPALGVGPLSGGPLGVGPLGGGPLRGAGPDAAAWAGAGLGGVGVAARNGPGHLVLSGPVGALAVAEERLGAAGLGTRRLAVGQGFHSAQMEAMADAFAARAAGLPRGVATATVVSSVTGARVAGGVLGTAGYWRRQVREAVAFEEGLGTLAGAGYRTFLEVGPGGTLVGLGRAALAAADADAVGPGGATGAGAGAGAGAGVGRQWATSLRAGRGAGATLRAGAGRLYVAGVGVDWGAVDGRAAGARRRVALPTYPFQRQRYWPDFAPSAPTPNGPLPAGGEPVLGHAMLQHRVPAAIPIFQAHLSAAAFPFIADHRVGGASVLPGAVFAELALAAAAETDRRTYDVGDLVVRDLTFREPLPIGSERHAVQVVVMPSAEGLAGVQILSRGEETPAASWTLHATATAGRVPARGEGAPGELTALRARLTTAVAPDTFYGALHARGITLGSSCRAIHEMWAGDGEMLARVRTDSNVESGAYRFDPALLDGCLQVFGAVLWRAGETDGARTSAQGMRLLTRIAALHVSETPPAAVWCHAVLDAATGQGRLVVFDDAGRRLADATGLETAGVGAATAPQPLEDWFYQLAWEPAAGHTPALTGRALADGALAGRLRAEADVLFAEHHLERYDELHPEFSELAAAYAAEAVRELGCDLTAGQRFTTDGCAVAAGVVVAHRRLFARLLEILAEDGVLRRVGGDGTSWEVVGRATAAPTALLPELIERFPEFRAELRLTARCGAQLGAVLRGTADPLQLLFPGGSVAELEALYTNSPSAHVFNTLARRVVVDAVAAAPSDRRVRVLEIGGGTGGTTAFVAPALPADRVEYTFTDVSPLFLARAQERFAAHKFMRYEVLDIETPAPPAERYDVIIAANVLHATADLRQTLQHVRERLAPGGLLALLEGTRPERWVDLTFGMTEGWWRFTDRDLRPSSALLDAPTWVKLLEASGFRDVESVAPRQGTQQTVLLAQAPSAAPGRWLIAADDGGVEAALASRIRDAGGEATTLPAHGLRTESVFDGHDLGDYDRVVDLRALDVRAGATPASLGDRAAAVLDAMRVVGAARAPAPLWVVTRGAQAVESEAGVDAPIPPTEPMQAAFWGLGRTFALESPDVWGGLCDLDPGASDDENASALLAAITHGGEDQIAVRSGRMHVPRIERRPAPAVATPRFSADGAYLVTGGLGNLGLRVAGWLVEHGARHVVLNGRTELPPRAEWDRQADDSTLGRRVKAVRELEARGARVSVVAADLSRADAADLLATAFASEKLRGVVHAAAVFDTTPLGSLAAEDLRRVFDTKVVGATVVSALARAAGADFVVFFSSTTSLLGARGMAAYAAANQVLDAYAHVLRAEGVPAVAVNWGTWDEFGELPDAVRQSYVRSGLLPMPPADALDALGRALDGRRAQTTVAQIDWTALKAVYEARRRRPMLERIANRAEPTVRVVPDATADPTPPLMELSDAERGRRLLALVRDAAAAVLALGPDEVDPQLGLFEMGMDSLMSVELRARLERAVGGKLPSTLTFNYPTVNALAAYLSSVVAPRPEATRPAVPEADAVPVLAVREATVVPVAMSVDVDPDAASDEDLSEDDLAALLTDALHSLD